MRTVPSQIPFSYKTIRVTKSRIEKGLLAIPTSLAESFPKKRSTIDVFFSASRLSVPKTYTPYQSSSKECRIGGMKYFFEKNHIKNGDELVIQFLEENKYRIFTENQFHQSIGSIESAFDRSKDETDAFLQIARLSTLANSSPQEVLMSEYLRLSLQEATPRKLSPASPTKFKKQISASIRKLLLEIYGGKCQLTGFGFLMINGNPYFETHHLKAEMGDHLKNLLVVSPNIHAQFTHAKVKEYYDEHGWLRKARLNDQEYIVYQVIDKVPKFRKEIHGD
jgi:hypothetical protein